MTREQALKLLEYPIYKWSMDWDEREDGLNYSEAIELAISALRPVSREKVEKVWRGCDFCKIELDDYPYIVAHSDYSSSDTCYEPSFCPICGKPLTDEAAQMVIVRLEALKNES